MLVVDGIHNVSLANGLVRIQVAQVGADGTSKGVDEIAIQASQFANVVQALNRAGQNLRQRLEQQQREQAENQQGSSEQNVTDPAAEAENFDFSSHCLQSVLALALAPKSAIQSAPGKPKRERSGVGEAFGDQCGAGPPVGARVAAARGHSAVAAGAA